MAAIFAIAAATLLRSDGGKVRIAVMPFKMLEFRSWHKAVYPGRSELAGPASGSGHRWTSGMS